MHPLTCFKYGAAALALGLAHSVMVPRGATSEYRICVSIIISAYGTTFRLMSATSKIHYCIGSLNVGVARVLFINPRRACARVTVLVLVCVFPYSGTSRNQAYKQQYQRLQRDTGMKYKKGFFFKTLRSEVMASFTHLE